jgi:hypothetical protein
LDYAQVKDVPHITLNYERVANKDREGKITVWLEKENERVCLAEVTGHLTIPIYDLRRFLPELYRFYDDRLYVLRLWFFWTDERMDADDLLTFVPDAQKDALRDQKTKEAADLMKSKLLGVSPSWDKQYEIPDIERFDIVFDPDDLTTKYGCTDAHWKEFWFLVGPDEKHQSQPCQCRISAPKDAIKIVFEYLAKRFEITGEEPPLPITNPLEEGGLVSLITNGRCLYDNETEQIVNSTEVNDATKAPGLLGKNAPRVENSKLLANGLSSDVLAG